jgi:hypothetical protein
MHAFESATISSWSFIRIAETWPAGNFISHDLCSEHIGVHVARVRQIERRSLAECSGQWFEIVRRFLTEGTRFDMAVRDLANFPGRGTSKRTRDTIPLVIDLRSLDSWIALSTSLRWKSLQNQALAVMCFAWNGGKACALGSEPDFSTSIHIPF